MVNKTAVTITYCNRDNCVRTFTDDREQPLPIGVAGFQGGLRLRVGDSYLQQANTQAQPYRSMPFKRVKWGEWKKEHPDTDLYVGSLAPPGSPAVPEGGW